MFRLESSRYLLVESSKEREQKCKNNEAGVCLVFYRNRKKKSMITVSKREGYSRRHVKVFAR